MRCTHTTIIIIAAAVCFFKTISFSGDDEIKKKQTQLQKLKSEIESYEQHIKEKEKKEHATLDLLDAYDRQTTLLRRLISKLHEQEVVLQSDIDSTRVSIADLNNQLSSLKNHYAHYVSSVYRYGRMYDLELLLSSKSVNQALVRAEYLKRFSEQRKKDLDTINYHRDTLETKSVLLQKQLAEQHDLIGEKQHEEKTLAQKMKKRKNLLANIRRDKKNFTKERDRKLQSVKDLQNLIAKLIEEDLRKKEEEKKSSTAPPERTAGASAFEAKRGHLRWPVSQGHLVSHFGNQENPTLHTVTQNIGIEISVPAGTGVSAIAGAEVSMITWMPSFGNTIILNHKNGYRTVYAHLSEFSVAEGDNVSEGQIIGKSGESLTGPMLFFGIYKEKEKQDPEQWLLPHGLSPK